MLSQSCFLSCSSSTSWYNYGNYSNNFVPLQVCNDRKNGFLLMVETFICDASKHMMLQNTAFIDSEKNQLTPSTSISISAAGN